MKKLLKQFSAGFLAIALVFSAIPPIQAKAETAESTTDTFTALSIDDVTVYERQTGYYEEDEDGNEWFKYNVKQDDWAVEYGGEWYTREEISEFYGYADFEEFDFLDGGYYWIDYEDDQSADNPWNTGSYTVTAKLYDCKEFRENDSPTVICSTTFQYNIIENPVKSIVFQDKVVSDGESGYWTTGDSEDNQDWYYRYSSLNNWYYTVTFKDGSQYVHTDDDDDIGFWYKGVYFDIDFYSDQSAEKPWGAGTNKVEASVGEYTTEYNYVITKSPIKSVTVGDVKVLKNTNGYYSSYWEEDEDGEIQHRYFRYSFDSDMIPITVTMNDGTVLNSVTDGRIYYDDKYYEVDILDDQSYYNQWGVGKHIVKVGVGSFLADCNVTITCGNHAWDNGKVTTAATCTSKGEMTYTCVDCGETKTALVAAKGHKPGAVATCKAPQTCVDCGAILAAKTGHTPGAAATCTAPQTCTVCQAILAVPTGHTAGPDATCTTAQNCAKCGVELEKVKGHAVALREKAKATTEDNGEIVETCICGQVMSSSSIAKVKTVKLAKTKYAYAGKAIAPDVTVNDSAGKVLVAGTDYDVTYKNNNKVGKATATVKFKGDYSGSAKLEYTINPAKPTNKKPVAAKKALTAKWSKVSKQATGYEVMIATNKNFTKNKKTVIVKSYKTTSKKIAKLKSKKTYYVKVRTYKTVGKVKYYSDWSAVKSVKVK